jgi:hypothetical protein
MRKFNPLNWVIKTVYITVKKYAVYELFFDSSLSHLICRKASKLMAKALMHGWKNRRLAAEYFLSRGFTAEKKATTINHFGL